MTKQEFENIIQTECPEDAFKTINFVYTFHPSISETEGKQQIAYLFNTFGMRIIADMHLTAVKAQELEDKIRNTRASLDLLTRDFADLKAAAYGC
jgi:hypothetical protein